MKPLLSLVAMLLTAAPIAHATDGNWFARVGVHAVDPSSDGGRLAGGTLAVTLDTDVEPTITLGRRLSPHWAIELLAAAPFRHTATLGGGDALDFKHLPPTLSVQYIFAPDARVQPFVGVGLNSTLTFDEKESGALAGTRTRVGNSFGPAAQIGLVFETGRAWNVVADARWMDIDADVSVDGVDVGTVSVDPLVYGIALGWRF